MSQFVSSGRMPFCLGIVVVTEDDCRIDIYPPSKYLKVEMVEATKPVSADFKKEISEGHTQDVTIKEPEIAFKKINPTRYVVDVKAERPFWLVFSESFHAGWKAYGRKKKEGRRQKAEVNEKNEEHWSALVSAWRDEGKRVELTEHQMVNGYANGWYVPVGQKTEVRSQKSEEEEEKLIGDFQIVLEYRPQRLFEIGILISGITFVLCIGYLCCCGIRNIVTKKKKIVLSTDFTD
jgi:hypothetical protein